MDMRKTSNPSLGTKIEMFPGIGIISFSRPLKVKNSDHFRVNPSVKVQATLRFIPLYFTMEGLELQSRGE